MLRTHSPISRARLGFGYFASTTQPVRTRQQCSYMGAWASQATVPFIQHICRYVQISSNICKRKNRSTKAGHENPKKPAGGKNTGTCTPDQGSGATLGVLGYASA